MKCWQSAVILVLLAVAGGCGDNDTVSNVLSSTTAVSTTSMGTTTTLEEPSLVFVSVSGDVEVTSPDGEPAAATAGTEVDVGASIITGNDAVAVLETRDGVAVFLAEGSHLNIETLGNGQEPQQTILGLGAGRVLAVAEGPIPEGGVFEIATPGFTAGLTGSGLGVDYLDGGAVAEVTCLFGNCYVRVDGATTDLTGEEWIDLADGVGVVGSRAGFTALQRSTWARVLSILRNAGHDVCTCDERSLLCEGVTEIPFFPGCPDDTTCECEGPDLVCEDGRMFEDDQQCMAAIPPLADLFEMPFTAVYDCVEARARWIVFESLPAEDRPPGVPALRLHEEQVTGCGDVLPFYPETYTLSGVGADGSLTGAGTFSEGDGFEVVVADTPGEAVIRGVFGPRFPGVITVAAWSRTSGTYSILTSSGDAYTLTPRGEVTISVAGTQARAVRYEGDYTEHRSWEAPTGVRASLDVRGTYTLYLDAVTGLELRSEDRATFIGCSNCDRSMVGVLERLHVIELVSSSQAPTPAG